MNVIMNHLLFEELPSLNAISDLRNQYLNKLLEAQELYLELFIRNSKVFVIKSQGRQIGYYLLGTDATLLEYFVISEYIDHSDEILGEILGRFSIRKALCKSFDHTFLSCCIGFQKKVNVLGIHFREKRDKDARPSDEGLTVRLATTDDEQHIIEINEAVFEHDEEVREYIQSGKIFLFEKKKNIVGFGIFSRVIEGRPEFDIGVLVETKFRRQGYGEYIVRYLADYCSQNGWRAICGCAIENTGSRKCLENAGFIAQYRLLEFVFHS
ncbi:MAG: N-acetyltransferase [Ignavibacteriae bacterium]|nr:MAG: N-acetyltransferase [Ignavibacteriota bacterium]